MSNLYRYTIDGTDEVEALQHPGALDHAGEGARRRQS